VTKLHVSPDLSLPLDWMTLATVVYGARGSGKTTLGSVIAEEVTKAKQRFCAVDLKGDWYGLKSTADGKGDGIPVVVFGGDHQDVPLEPDAGTFIAETIASMDQSCILDFEYFSKGKQVRFLAQFFETLYDRNRDPLLLLLDEAQRYAPQKPIDPDAAKCLGAVGGGLAARVTTDHGARTTEGITARQQRFLDAAATLTTLNVEVSRETVSAWLGVHPRGGSVGEELKALEDEGYIRVDRGAITVTDRGFSVANIVSQEEAIASAREGLSSRQRRIFDIIAAEHPNAISREAIAAKMQIHPRGGSFGEDLGRLRGRGLIEYDRGEARARDFLFAGIGV